MIVPDVNLLLYAYDSRSPFHVKAKAWWEGIMSEGKLVGVPWVVVLGFIRLATHPTINENPMTVNQVSEIVDTWLERPNVELLSPQASTLKTLFVLLKQSGLGGKLTTDAMIAAHAVESTGKVYSNDRDFDRFEKVKWVNPLKD